LRLAYVTNCANVQGGAPVEPMTEYATKDEFQHLATRVDILEREVEGEKTVMRYILEQARRNGDDLAAIKTRLDRVEHRLDGLERRLDGLERRIDGLERKVDDLTKALPRIVGEAIREAFRERDRT
jgi:cell division protein FtsB